MTGGILCYVSEQPRNRRRLVRVAVGQRAAVDGVDRDQWPDVTGEVVEILGDGAVGVRRDDTGKVLHYHPLDVYPETPHTQLQGATNRARQWMAAVPDDQLRALNPDMARHEALVVLKMTIYALAVSTSRPVAAVTPGEVRDVVATQHSMARWWTDTLFDVAGYPAVAAALRTACEPGFDDSFAINGSGRAPYPAVMGVPVAIAVLDQVRPPVGDNHV